MRLAVARNYEFLNMNDYEIKQIDKAYSKIDIQAVKNGRDLAEECLYRKMLFQIKLGKTFETKLIDEYEDALSTT